MHEFDDWSEFCVRCGQARQEIVDKELECFGGGNLLAMTHLRCRQRQEELVSRIYNEMA